MLWGNRAFKGARPRLAARLLPDNAAAEAHNCWLNSGILKPLPQLAPIMADGAAVVLPAGTRSIFRLDDRWLAWTDDVDAVPAPVRSDTDKRILWTGEGSGAGAYARQTSTVIMQGAGFTGPGSPPSRRLGVPAPDNAPSVVLGAFSSEATETPAESQAWVYTYVTDLGEEGPPSAPSAVMARGFNDDGTIRPATVTTDAGPTGSFHVNRKRIYRSTGAATYQLVAERPVAETSYAESVLTARLGAGLESSSWTAPPTDLRGLIVLPNGICAAFREREVWLSEPYRPHAWPAEYVQVVDAPIVGLGAYGSTIVVGTTGKPHVIDVNEPSTAVPFRLELDQACVSKHSFARWGEQGVVYASPDGLVLVSSRDATLITRDAFDRTAWQALGPAGLRGAFHDDAYLAFLAGSTVAFSREFEGVVTTPDVVVAVFEDRARDEIAVAVGTQLLRWGIDGGTARTMRWRSRDHPDLLRNFSAAQVIADAYPVTLELWADGARRARIAVQGVQPFRLPATALYREWSYRVEAAHAVKEVRIGAMAEML